MMRKPWALILAVVVTLSFAACSKDVAAKGGVQMVAGHQFSPRSVEITVGETLTFTNETAESHTVTAYERSPAGSEYFASGGFSSEEAARDDVAGGLIEEGATYSVTLDEPGTYEYFCIPHESDGMKGTIVVVPKS